jgi:hypothetical protein
MVSLLVAELQADFGFTATSKVRTERVVGRRHAPSIISGQWPIAGHGVGRGAGPQESRGGRSRSGTGTPRLVEARALSPARTWAAGVGATCDVGSCVRVRTCAAIPCAVCRVPCAVCQLPSTSPVLATTSYPLLSCCY